jgi:V8-like Glu-specific endopeptidase
MKTVAHGELYPDADIRLPGFTGQRCEPLGDADRPIPYYQAPPPRARLVPRSRERLATGLPDTAFPPDSRERIGNPRSYPYSAICALQIFNPKDELYYGTGFLAGPRLVLTAGHNVFYHGEGFMKAIHVYPGLNGDRRSPPFRGAVATRMLTVEAWVNGGDTQFDFGAIILPTDLGNDVGWFSIGNFTDATLKALTVTLAGYPKEPPSNQAPLDGSTMWWHLGKLAIEPNRLLYTIDTTIGQSGSPVFAHFPDKNDPYQAVGIHNRAFDTLNAATRINDAVFAQILQWRTTSDG